MVTSLSCKIFDGILTIEQKHVTQLQSKSLWAFLAAARRHVVRLYDIRSTKSSPPPDAMWLDCTTFDLQEIPSRRRTPCGSLVQTSIHKKARISSLLREMVVIDQLLKGFSGHNLDTGLPNGRFGMRSFAGCSKDSQRAIRLLATCGGL